MADDPGDISGSPGDHVILISGDTLYLDRLRQARHSSVQFGKAAVLGSYTLLHAGLLSVPRAAASSLYFGLGNLAFEHANYRFFPADTKTTSPRGDSTLTSPLAGTQGIALAVKNFTTAQGFAIGAVVGLVNTIPQTAWDLTDRIYSLVQSIKAAHASIPGRRSTYSGWQRGQ